MNEAQEKPKKKWYKKWQFIATSLLLLIAVISFLLAWALSNPYHNKYQIPGYNSFKEQVQIAVTAYQANINMSPPTLIGTYTNANCSNCSVVNMSALLIANGGLLRQIPEGCYLSGNAGMDNCNNNKNLGCKVTNHYIWIVNVSNGDVYSYCAGADCITNNSGYQGVWP